MLRRSSVFLVALLLPLGVLGASTALVEEPSSSSAAASAAKPPAVTAIGVVKDRSGTQITISGDADLKYEYFVIEGRSLIVDIPGATSKVWPADQAINDESVGRVRVAEQTGAKPSVRIVFDLRSPEGFTVRGDGNRIVVSFAARKGSSAPAPVTWSAPTPGNAPAAPAGAPVPDYYPTAAVRTPVSGGGTGRPITLDFIDADITDIFRLIADVSGMNIIASDDVKGRRTVKMTEVPWDRALDLILRTNIPQLARVDEGSGVIRVTTQQRIADEESLLAQQKIMRLEMAVREQEMARKSADAALALEESEIARQEEELKRRTPLEIYNFNVSYGDTKLIADRLKKYYSNEDGKPPVCEQCIFEVDERSNRIMVRDLSANIDSMIDVFEALDEQTPAVMVEARIVEVLSNMTENLGIQWGANFAADPSHGNATRYAFPNSIGIGGIAQQGDTGINPGSYLVNLPAAGSVGGIGLNFGHIANTFSLDVKLSALEALGKTKILSNPKVLVIQNEEAKINVGSQLPIPKTDTTGNRTIEWKDVGILLMVKPQVTNDGSVFMKVQIEKSARGETVQTTEGSMFSIERRGADTKVLVGDGETTVIGGIFIQTAADSQTGIPWFSKLPVLGALFKSKSTSENRTELMIFLTPRITFLEKKASAERPSRDRTRTPHFDSSQDASLPARPAGR